MVRSLRPQFSKSTLLGWGRRAVETLPLTVFLVIVGVTRPEHADHWLGPFVAGASVAVCVTAIAIWRNALENVLMLGVNGYLVFGATGLLVEIDWINGITSQFRAAGMLMAVCAAIAVDGARRWRAEGVGFDAVRPSVLLLGAGVVLTGSAYVFRDARPWSEIVPFALLFALGGFVNDRRRTEPVQ